MLPPEQCPPPGVDPLWDPPDQKDAAELPEPPVLVLVEDHHEDSGEESETVEPPNRARHFSSSVLLERTLVLPR